MATFNKTQHWAGVLGFGHANLNTDAMKIGLTNTAPTATGTTVWADITEIATGNGYVGGGIDIGNTGAEAGGTFTMQATGDPSWTATGGSIGPFRYAVLYDDTIATGGFVDAVAGWWDYGSGVTLTTGETFTVDLTITSVATIS